MRRCQPGRQQLRPTSLSSQNPTNNLMQSGRVDLDEGTSDNLRLHHHHLLMLRHSPAQKAPAGGTDDAQIPESVPDFAGGVPCRRRLFPPRGTRPQEEGVSAIVRQRPAGRKGGTSPTRRRRRPPPPSAARPRRHKNLRVPPSRSPSSPPGGTG